MREKLKVGIMIDSFQLFNWEKSLIERIINSKYAEIDLVIINRAENKKLSFLNKLTGLQKNVLYRIINKLDTKIFTLEANAFKKLDCKYIFDGIEMISVAPERKKYSDHFGSDDIKRIKSFSLDVIIRLGFRILRGEILKCAEYGVWSYHHGDNSVNRGGPAGYWELIKNWDVTGTTLQILTEDLDGGRLLYKSFSATDKRSFIRNRNNIYWKSVSFIPRKLEELHRDGGDEFLNRVNNLNRDMKVYSNQLFKEKNLNNYIMFKFLITNIFKYFIDKIYNLIFLEQWILLFNIGNGISSSIWRFKKIVPPNDRFYADPFVMYEKGLYYIFIEEYIYKKNKGHISVLAVDSEGSYSKPVKILEKSYHLSYPFVFNHNEVFFLIPETSENRSIELYQSSKFPYEWEFKMCLMKNINAVDTTLFFYKNKWWLFTNIIENPGASNLDELFLFFSENLFSEKWIPHPLNPIISDVRNARSAGKIFMHKGRIIRPSQDCSKRYGFSTKLNEILMLDEKHYEEIPMDNIKPNWSRNIKATHTFNYVNNFTTIDGVFKRRRTFF